jgi:oxalate decarboxylase/phosphoglucose isomerase-like protein (cupin superfamily)
MRALITLTVALAGIAQASAEQHSEKILLQGNADEWQYVIEGDLSVTMFGSHGRFRTERLHKGDAGYIPQGYGHSIENSGDKPSRMLIGFNTDIYEAIDLSALDRRQSGRRSGNEFQ